MLGWIWFMVTHLISTHTVLSNNYLPIKLLYMDSISLGDTINVHKTYLPVVSYIYTAKYYHKIYILNEVMGCSHNWQRLLLPRLHKGPAGQSSGLKLSTTQWLSHAPHS